MCCSTCTLSFWEEQTLLVILDILMSGALIYSVSKNFFSKITPKYSKHTNSPCDSDGFYLCYSYLSGHQVVWLLPRKQNKTNMTLFSLRKMDSAILNSHCRLMLRKFRWVVLVIAINYIITFARFVLEHVFKEKQLSRHKQMLDVSHSNLFGGATFTRFLTNRFLFFWILPIVYLRPNLPAENGKPSELKLTKYHHSLHIVDR